MDESDAELDRRIARRLKALRAERGWSLEELARRCGTSRATLSRLENAEVSATAALLGRICAAFELPLSRLIHQAEADFQPLLPAAEQPVWSDRRTGFRRRSVSPPARGLAGEVLECSLRPGAVIDYPQPPRPGLEHHLLLLDGALTVEVEGCLHRLQPGDCLRYRLAGPSRFATPADSAARYLLFLV